MFVEEGMSQIYPNSNIKEDSGGHKQPAGRRYGPCPVACKDAFNIPEVTRRAESEGPSRP